MLVSILLNFEMLKHTTFPSKTVKVLLSPQIIKTLVWPSSPKVIGKKNGNQKNPQFYPLGQYHFQRNEEYLCFVFYFII